MLRWPQGDQGCDACPRREHYILDCAHQTALYARCAAGVIVIGGDVFHLLQENGSSREAHL